MTPETLAWIAGTSEAPNGEGEEPPDQPVAETDWAAWHEPYADPRSPLSRRLRLVQSEIASWLDRRPDRQLRVVSVCAGQGNDLLGVLARRTDAQRVSATLVELDSRNVAAARAAIAEQQIAGVTVIEADAGQLDTYIGLVPADLVLLVGVLGNIRDADVCRTIRALPQLCAAGATVIWSRARRPGDPTSDIRQHLHAAGFTELAFHAPDDAIFTIGVHRHDAHPPPLIAPGTLFTFI